MPSFLSLLPQRTRAGILVMLLVVLPLQGVVQLVAGMQGQHRHVHTGTASSSPLRALLDRLHDAQNPRLQRPAVSWAIGKGPSCEAHEHGGVFHTHSHDTADVLDVGDPADDARRCGVTAFLAWLPSALALPAGEEGDCPVAAVFGWRDRVVAPPLAPPRG